MTSKKCFKYNPQLYVYVWMLSLEPLILGRLRPERLTSNRTVSSVETLPGGISSPSISSGPDVQGPIFPPNHPCSLTCRDILITNITSAVSIDFQNQMCLCVRKPTIWVPTRSDTNRDVQSPKMVRSLKFRI